MKGDLQLTLRELSRKELRHALTRADPALFEEVLQYLEADSLHFGSGYDKELFWRYIRRYDLKEQHIKRLCAVALKYLERPMSREFQRMCLAMAYLGMTEFWEQVQAAAESDNPRVQVNAYCLLPYANGVEAGERNRLELKSLKQKSFYRHRSLWRTFSAS